MIFSDCLEASSSSKLGDIINTSMYSLDHPPMIQLETGNRLTPFIPSWRALIEMVAFWIGSLSVQNVVNRILCIVCTTRPLCNATVPCGLNQWDLMDSRLHSASRVNAATSYFKLSQVLETSVTQINPNVLVPQKQGYRTEPPVPTIVSAAGIKPGILSMWSCDTMHELNLPTQDLTVK